MPLFIRLAESNDRRRLVGFVSDKQITFRLEFARATFATRDRWRAIAKFSLDKQTAGELAERLKEWAES